MGLGQRAYFVCNARQRAKRKFLEIKGEKVLKTSCQKKKVKKRN